MNSSAALTIATPQPASRPPQNRDSAPTDNAFSRALHASAEKLNSETHTPASGKPSAASDAKDATDTPALGREDDVAEGGVVGAQAEVLDLPAQALSWAEHVMSRRTAAGAGTDASAAPGSASDSASQLGRRAGAQWSTDAVGPDGLRHQAIGTQRGLHASREAESLGGGATANSGAGLESLSGRSAGRFEDALAPLTGSSHDQRRPAPAGAAIDRSRLSTERRIDATTFSSQPLTLAPGLQESVSAKLSADMASRLGQHMEASASDARTGEALLDLKPATESVTPLFQQMMRDAAVDIVPRAINVPVGHAHWGQAVGQQVVAWSQQARAGEIKAELRLDPPDMGPLRVSLHIIDGVTTASFASAHAAVRQALEQAMPQLQQAFSQAGLSLGDTQVGDSNTPGTDGSGSDNANHGQPSNGGNSHLAGDSTNASMAASPRLGRETVGLVDTFA